MEIAILIVFFAMLLFAVRAIVNAGKKNTVSVVPALSSVHELLSANVPFYVRLDEKLKVRFRQEVAAFLASVLITPVNTVVDEADRVMVAAGAVIPMFAFEGWRYPHLEEVLLYNDHFNKEFQTEGDANRNIMGLVGTGVYKNKMLLSKNALRAGFGEAGDKANTAIHEFVHLIDGADGDTDGLPGILLDKKYTKPWLDLIHAEMEKMHDEDSDINPYGYTNKTEFFAVAAEYFFERPDLFEEKHPELFRMMQTIFKTNSRKPDNN